MKIVHVVHHYHPVIGGIERVVQRIAEEQAKLGHEVHVITSKYGAKGRPKEEIINGVHVHRVKAHRLLYPDLTIPREIPKEVLKQTDVVHAHSQNSLFNMMILKRIKRRNPTIALHFMAVDALKTHPNIIKRTVGAQYQEKMTKEGIKLADLHLVKSRRDEEVLKKKYALNPVYIPDGIDEYYLTKPKDETTFREKFGIHEENVILYIGRLHPAKGPHILIKAIPHITKHERDIKVVFIGPGDSTWLIKLAKKLNVEKYTLFTGPVPEEVKISAIDTSKCIVIPSLYDYVETFSLVASEAWARGKPVIASAVGELPYRVKHEANGLLVPPNDPEALANAIRISLHCNNFMIREELTTWVQIADILCNIYRHSITIRSQ